tara:strand:+ start:29619 stop:30377 length:759 start_codon:yes stop_codon:yes gene_type:complete
VRIRVNNQVIETDIVFIEDSEGLDTTFKPKPIKFSDAPKIADAIENFLAPEEKTDLETFLPIAADLLKPLVSSAGSAGNILALSEKLIPLYKNIKRKKSIKRVAEKKKKAQEALKDYFKPKLSSETIIQNALHENSGLDMEDLEDHRDEYLNAESLLVAPVRISVDGSNVKDITCTEPKSFKKGDKAFFFIGFDKNKELIKGTEVHASHGRTTEMYKRHGDKGLKYVMAYMVDAKNYNRIYARSQLTAVRNG